MNDCTYEKLRFEALKEKKDVSQIISERILYKEFSEDVEQAFSEFCDEKFTKLMEE